MQSAIGGGDIDKKGKVEEKEEKEEEISKLESSSQTLTEQL